MSRDRLGEVLRGDQYEEEPTPTFPGVYSGTVSKVDAKGLYFTVPSYDRDAEFGPAPWPRLPTVTGERQQASGPAIPGDYALHDHPLRAHAGNPPKGTRCAVAFADGDPDQPLVLALYGWPA